MRVVILEPWRNPAAASGQWIPAASLGIAAIGLLSGPGAGSDKEFKPPEQAKKARVAAQGFEVGVSPQSGDEAVPQLQ